MIETIFNIDLVIFKLLNQTWSNPVFDVVMPFITDKYTWIPLYVAFLIFFIYRFRKQAYIPIIGLALAVGAADFTTSGIIKPNVDRVRPCNIEATHAITFKSCSSSPSFPSSHAANHFAIAIFLLYFLPKKWKWVKITFLIWAFAIAYSRVYVGVHFPTDVFAGGVIGIILGCIFALASRNIMHRFGK